MDQTKEEDDSGPSSLSSDQASLCVIPDPDDSSEEDGFIYLDKSSLPASLNVTELERTVIVFHSVDEEYPANQDVVCQYIRPEGWEESEKDNISLFKVGWVTKNDAMFMLPLPLPSNDPIGQIIIPENMLPKDTVNLYQFCYMRDHTLLGASTPFQFVLPNIRSYSSVGEMLQDEVGENQTLTCSECSEKKLGDDKNTCNSLDLGREHSSSSNKETSSQQICERTPPLTTGNDKDSPLDFKYDYVNAMLPFGKQFLTEENLKLRSLTEESEVTKSLMAISFVDAADKSNVSGQVKNFIEQPSKDELSCLKQRMEDINEERMWFQEQYNSLLTTVKKLSEDLSAERSEKESLNGYVAELAITHKILCSENSRLDSELQTVKQNLKDQPAEVIRDRERLEEKLQDVSAENFHLKEELHHTHLALKEAETENKMPAECKCVEYKRQVEDLASRLSDHEMLRNCLEVELAEEIKLGQERDHYIKQMEQIKVNNLQMATNWIASTPNSFTDGNTICEMEENVNSTLLALECALKEMEALRSRKAAVTKEKSVLRDELVLKRNEWEERSRKERTESDVQQKELKKQLECERSVNAGLEKKLEILSDQLEGISHENIFRSYQTGHQQKSVHEALDKAKKEIEILRKQKADVDREYTSLRLQQKLKTPRVDQDINTTLLKSLEEAKEEYIKLYTEKLRFQLKLHKLEQKLEQKAKSKMNSQTPQEVPNHQVDFMNNVSTSWRATIDELM